MFLWTRRMQFWQSGWKLFAQSLKKLSLKGKKVYNIRIILEKKKIFFSQNVPVDK